MWEEDASGVRGVESKGSKTEFTITVSYSALYWVAEKTSTKKLNLDFSSFI